MKSLLLATGSTLFLGSAMLIMKISKAYQDDEKKKLLEIMEDIKTEYIPIYVHSYNMFVNSMRELKNKPGMEEFVKQQIQDQSKLYFRLRLHSRRQNIQS